MARARFKTHWIGQLKSAALELVFVALMLRCCRGEPDILRGETVGLLKLFVARDRGVVVVSVCLPPVIQSVMNARHGLVFASQVFMGGNRDFGLVVASFDNAPFRFPVLIRGDFGLMLRLFSPTDPVCEQVDTVSLRLAVQYVDWHRGVDACPVLWTSLQAGVIPRPPSFMIQCGWPWPRAFSARVLANAARYHRFELDRFRDAISDDVTVQLCGETSCRISMCLVHRWRTRHAAHDVEDVLVHLATCAWLLQKWSGAIPCTACTTSAGRRPWKVMSCSSSLAVQFAKLSSCVMSRKHHICMGIAEWACGPSTPASIRWCFASRTIWTLQLRSWGRCSRREEIATFPVGESLATSI